VSTRVPSLRKLLVAAMAAAVALVVPLVEPGQTREIIDPDRVPDADVSASIGSSRWGFTRTEKCLMKKTNKRRARNGQRTINWDKQLGYVARQHARSMAGSGAVYHDSNIGSKVTRWRALGQNSGRAGGCKRLFLAFWNSSKHRANILGSWRFMAVGTEKRNGRLYAQHVFESRRNPGNIYNRP
jgi:uncharacterized protein YkwD